MFQMMIVRIACHFHSYHDDFVVVNVLDHNVMCWVMEVTNCYYVNQYRSHYFAHVVAVVRNYGGFVLLMSDMVVDSHKQMMLRKVEMIYKTGDDHYGIHYYVHRQ